MRITSLTDDEIMLLKRYSRNGYISYFGGRWWVSSVGDVIDERVLNYLTTIKYDNSANVTVLTDEQAKQLVNVCKCFE